MSAPKITITNDFRTPLKVVHSLESQSTEQYHSRSGPDGTDNSFWFSDSPRPFSRQGVRLGQESVFKRWSRLLPTETDLLVNSFEMLPPNLPNNVACSPFKEKQFEICTTLFPRPQRYHHMDTLAPAQKKQNRSKQHAGTGRQSQSRWS